MIKLANWLDIGLKRGSQVWLYFSGTEHLMLVTEVDNTAKNTSVFEFINWTYKLLKFRMDFLRAVIFLSRAADKNEAKKIWE